MFIRIAALLAAFQATGAVGALSGEARAMVEDSMAWMDRFYDSRINQLYDLESRWFMDSAPWDSEVVELVDS
ncbi:unnamed protein product [Clonostachys rosea f. rosea IK726]|uniref:Uncharacterized protein n=1 Tax=Clonostachys rosea f. rosea IK726 TaxID=1349383 RepID=A0ACA9UD05_BIOOC|nr:unnamed protein product [Clonostachys rosea f. rosea IK726]